MASTDGTSVPANVQAKVNGIVEQDAAKGRVPVHTFDPDASPESKAADAGKQKQKLGIDRDDVKTGGKGECIYILDYSTAASVRRKSALSHIRPK